MSTLFDESAPPLAPAHAPFDDVEAAPPAASPVRAALTASTGRSAVNVAKARVLAETLGIPEGVALADPAGAQREYDAFILESNKRLAAWAAQTPDNAAIAKAEPKALGSLFDAAAEIPRFFAREAAALGSAWDKGSLQVQYSALGERYRSGDDSVLPEIEGIRQRMGEAEKIKSGTMASSIGLATATEQLPLQLNMAVPSATEAFGMGTAVWGGATLATGGTGALIGSVVPGPGTLAGGAAGAIGAQPAAVAAGMTAAKATYLFRQAQRSFSMERGAFIADLALEKDVNEQPLPRDVQNAAADVYGLMAAAVETGGEAIFLKLLKPLGGQAIVEKFGEQGLKAFLKSAVKRAAFDQSTRGVLMDIGARIGLHSLAEGLEESVQEVASILIESVAKEYVEGRDGQVHLDTAIFTPENAERVRESFTGGLAAGAWLGGGPIIVSGAFDVRSAQQAQRFAQGHSDLHGKVEATEIKQLSPSHTQEILEAADPSLQEEVQLPADALLELYQDGTDLLGPLGLSEEQVTRAAGMGHSFEVSVSRLHANLDQGQFDAAAQIMRRSPDSFSAREADRVDNKIAADAKKVATLYQEQASELSALEKERERVRNEAVAAVESVPGLKAQAKSMAGGVEAYVDQWVTTLDAFARRMAPQGESIAETFRRMAINSLDRPSLTEAREAFQPPIEEVRAADIALQEDSEAWAGALQAFAERGLSPRKTVPMLRQTPLVLQMLGAENLPVVTTYNVLKKVLVEKHKLPVAALQQVPAAMADPVMVFRSATQGGDLVMMLDVKDQNGATVVVPLALKQDSPEGYSVNLATSVYAKNKAEHGAANNRWFINQIENGNLLYRNHKKSRAWEAMVGLQLPPTHFTNTGKKNLYTDANLVKLREANPELYHDGSDDPRGSVTIHPESYLVNLFQKADLTTLLHETGHIFLEEMERALDAGIADKAMSDDYTTLRGWVGAKEGEPLSVEQKEQIARGFEAYLMEGKAPSQELQTAFSRFRRWLLTIYKSAQRLRAELTDEVRGVFDRMLATEREIAASSAQNELIDLTNKELDALGLTGAERTYAAGLMAAARTAAAEKLQLDRDRQRKRRLATYALEAREELRSEPAYIARSAMRKTPLDIDAVRNDFGEDVALELMRRAPASLKRGGEDPQIFAAEQGFENGAAMVQAVLNSKSLKEAVSEKVKAKEVAYDADFVATEYLVETDQAQEQVSLVGKYLAANQGQEYMRQQAFARVAEQELTNMPMQQAVQTGNFLAAMRRALRQERQAIGEGDFAAALEANHKARLNLEFTRRSREISRRQQTLQRQTTRFVKMTKADPDARFVVMDIAMRYGLGRFNATLAEGRDGGNVQAWLRGAEADGYTLFVDDATLYGPGKPWREMNVGEFESLAETVAQIVTVERNRRQLLTAQGKADLDEVAATIAGEIGKHRDMKALKTVERDPAALKLVSGVHAVHTKIEALCLALDGDRHGPAWEFIYKPITQADDNQNVRFKEARNALRKLFGVYSRRELTTIGHKKVFVKEIGESLTHENRLALALNMGNAANISRIREGHGWTDDQISAALRSLTKRDWEFVQSVWDYLETFRDESFALQEAVTGMRPRAVEPQPLTVQTAEGQTLNLRGGYYPIRYNSEKGFRAFQQEQAAMDKEFFGGRNYGAAQTRQGHLKERAKGGQKAPLLLELTVPVDHVFNVIHDLAFRKAVLDVAKVIRHGTVRQAIEGSVGKELYRELLPWLQDVANERQEPMHYMHRMARWARASTSIMQMGWKFTTMFTQPLGYTQTVEVLGYKWAGYGLKRVYGNMLKLPALIEETFARSPMMANRIKSFDREVRDITKRLTATTGLFGWVDKVRDSAFVPMGVFQMGVDLPTWWGAYAKGLQDYSGNEIKAAQYADSMVRMSQGSGSTKDLSRVQRGSDLARLATMFYSYFNTFYNLAARRFSDLKRDHSPAAIFRAANTALLIWFIPAVLSELVAGRGPGSGDDEDEDVLTWAGMNILQYPWQAVVGLRDIANGVFGEFDYQITPAQAAPKSFVKWADSVRKALEEEDAGRLIKPTAEALGYAYNLPLKQVIITAGNVWDYLTGEDPDLEVRDLFFVKPKHRR